MKNYRRAIRYHILKFLRLRGTPWKVALGFAIGACVNFYPTFGAGVVVAGLLASAFRVSIAAALLGDLSLKSVFPVCFYFNLVTGDFLLGEKPKHLFFTLEKMMTLKHLNLPLLRMFGKSFLIGALVNSLIFGGILAVLVHLVFARYRPALVRFVYHLKKKE